MKRRKEQPEKLKQKSTETGSDWRELLQMEMPQVFGKSITEQHLLMNMIPKNQKKLRLWKKSIRKKIPRDEENTEKIVEEENSAAEDFYEEDSEKDTEEVSEEEAFPEASSTENHVEENAGISEEETVATKDPTASEEDEWLYSQPRRFAKKPAHEQED